MRVANRTICASYEPNKVESQPKTQFSVGKRKFRELRIISHHRRRRPCVPWNILSFLTKRTIWGLRFLATYLICLWALITCARIVWMDVLVWHPHSVKSWGMQTCAKVQSEEEEGVVPFYTFEQSPRKGFLLSCLVPLGLQIDIQFRPFSRPHLLIRSFISHISTYERTIV